MKKDATRLAIFASGSGSNAEAIIDFFDHNDDVEVNHIYSNKARAFVLERAKKFAIPWTTFDRNEFYNSEVILDSLINAKIDLIVLAGFMWLVPQYLIDHFPNRIINIHPALLPKYGGKGMYGHHVHDAVIANHEEKSGISIHYVSSKYDEGNIIFQAECLVEANDNPDDLAHKIHQLEHYHYPRIINKLSVDLKNQT